MTSCSELEEEEDNGSDRQDNSLRVADKALTVLEALPTRMECRQIFCLPDKMCQYVIATIQYP